MSNNDAIKSDFVAFADRQSGWKRLLDARLYWLHIGSQFRIRCFCRKSPLIITMSFFIPYCTIPNELEQLLFEKNYFDCQAASGGGLSGCVPRNGRIRSSVFGERLCDSQQIFVVAFHQSLQIILLIIFSW